MAFAAFAAWTQAAVVGVDQVRFVFVVTFEVVLPSVCSAAVGSLSLRV